MNELSVVIEKRPGTLVWTNYPDIVAELDKVLKEYKQIAYTEDTIRDAKADKATLNKLKNEIEDARKSAKRIWMEPYQMIEDKAKHLTGMIDSQIAEIDKSLNEYEAARKAKAKEEIDSYMQKAANALPFCVRAAFCDSVYDARWLNKTAKKAEWKKAVDDKAAVVRSEVECIRNMAEEVSEGEIAIRTYGERLSVTDAIGKLNELKKQKEVLKANITKEMLAKDDEKAVEAVIPDDFMNLPEENDELSDLMDLLSDNEPKKEQRKVLCIHGKGDYMREVQNLAEELGLDVWYQFMD